MSWIIPACTAGHKRYNEIIECGPIENIVHYLSSWQFWLLVAVLITFFTSFVIVPNKRAVIYTWFGGKVAKVCYTGFNFRMPFPIWHKAHTANLEQFELCEEVSVKTNDNAFLKLKVQAQFKVKDVISSFYELDDPQKQLMTYILNAIRTMVNGWSMEEVYSKKEDISNSIKTQLDTEFKEFGFELIKLLVDQPTPSKEVEDAFNRVIAAQRMKEAAENEGEAEKVKRVKAAEAQKEALVIQAQAYVAFRTQIAEGLGEVMKGMREAMPSITDAQILEFLAGVDRREAARDIGRYGGVVILSDGPITPTPEAIAAAQAAAMKDKKTD